MNEEKRLQRRQRLMDNKAYQTMEGLTRYMERYYPFHLAATCILC